MSNQAFFSELYRLWIWIGPPVMVAALVALGFVIKNLVTSVRAAVICSVPLTPTQAIEFREPGTVILNLDGPRLSRRFSGLTFVLNTSDGLPIEGRMILFRARTSGFSTASLSYKEFDIPRPGPYVLRIDGLGQPREDDSKHSIIFTRPHMAKTIAHILGIILAAGVFITSMVFLGLRLAGVE